MSIWFESFALVFGGAVLCVCFTEGVKAAVKLHNHHIFLAKARAAEMSPDEYREKTTATNWRDLLTPGLLARLPSTQLPYARTKLWCCPQCGSIDSLVNYVDTIDQYLCTCTRCGHRWYLSTKNLLGEGVG